MVLPCVITRLSSSLIHPMSSVLSSASMALNSGPDSFSGLGPSWHEGRDFDTRWRVCGRAPVLRCGGDAVVHCACCEWCLDSGVHITRMDGVRRTNTAPLTRILCCEDAWTAGCTVRLCNECTVPAQLLSFSHQSCGVRPLGIQIILGDALFTVRGGQPLAMLLDRRHHIRYRAP